MPWSIRSEEFRGGICYVASEARIEGKRRSKLCRVEIAGMSLAMAGGKHPHRRPDR
jgi:hypothetical protein